MGGQERKLLDRFKSIPADFTWAELTRLLEMNGYKEAQGSGSRVRFVGDGLPRIILHKPHPGNIVKQYVLRNVKNLLLEASII